MFRIAAAMLIRTTAAEWCVTAWGATFVGDAGDVSTDTAVALMAGYFGGVVGDRARAGADRPVAARNRPRQPVSDGHVVTIALVPERAALASGRAVMITSFAVLVAPLTVGTL